MRVELLGLSFTPQHSDARVLEQIIYKWQDSRRVIAQVLVDKYTALAQIGWQVTLAEVERDVKDLFGGNFQRFCGTQDGSSWDGSNTKITRKIKTGRGATPGEMPRETPERLRC